MDGSERVGKHAGEGIAAAAAGVDFEEAERQDSSHWLVRIGIWFRRRVLGWVVERPRFLQWMRLEVRMRSRMALEMVVKASRTAGGRGPKYRIYYGIQRAKMGLTRLEQSRLAVSQIFLRGLRIAGWT